MESTKDKIDKALGLADGQSIDDFLDNMSTDVNKTRETMDSMSDQIKDSLGNVDAQIDDIQNNPKSNLTITDLNASMKEVEDLIFMAKAMFKHIYENFCSSDLIDSELLHSASSFMESLHINIAEFISIYRDKMKFIEKIQMALFNQNLKKELMDKKHQQDIEKMRMKAESNVVDTTANGPIGSMTQEQISKMLAEMSDQQFNSIVEGQTDSDFDQQLGIPSDSDVETRKEEKEDLSDKENKNIKEQ